MSRIIARVFFVLFLFSLLIACGSGGGGGGAAPPAGGGGGGTQYGTIRLSNVSGVTIDEFYISLASSSAWGSDQLGSSTLSSGFYFDVANVPVGTYDARAIVLGALSIYHGDLYGFSVTANSTYNIVAGSGSFTGSIKIVNNTVGANIVALYVSPSSSPTWGSSQISSTIGPSGFQHLYYMPTGSYDVKVVWNVGPDTLSYGNTISSLSLLTLYVN